MVQNHTKAYTGRANPATYAARSGILIVNKYDRVPIIKRGISKAVFSCEDFWEFYLGNYFPKFLFFIFIFLKMLLSFHIAKSIL